MRLSSSLSASLLIVGLLAGLLAPAVVVAESDNAAQTTHYTFQWPTDDPTFFCTGTRIVKTAPQTFIKDSEECWSSDFSGEPGTTIFDPIWIDPEGAARHWYSDYDGRQAIWAKVVTYADGTSEATAYYDESWYGGTFGGHHYQAINKELTWHEAVDYCAQDGGYLVTINSAAENQFVYELRPAWFNATWLGATDEVTEGTWVWVTGEPFNSYTNWGSGEPNNSPPIPGSALGEDYLTFHGWDAYDPPMPGVWNDWQYEGDGSASMAPFVCEYGRG
jgi:hypothetical protein